jgi:hypothetical protein
MYLDKEDCKKFVNRFQNLSFASSGTDVTIFKYFPRKFGEKEPFSCSKYVLPVFAQFES